jgi:quercetin dioxygenase-like cupin family protein
MKQVSILAAAAFVLAAPAFAQAPAAQAPAAAAPAPRPPMPTPPGVTPPSGRVPNQVDKLVKSGPITSSIPLPSAANVPIVFGKDIKWNIGQGSDTAVLFGNPEQPGIYGVLYRWKPGGFSRPHSHSKVRYIYVVSGTWWVSSSTVYDPTKTYPVPAGSFVTDIPDTVHWDGARDEEAIIFLVGEGPMVSRRDWETDAAGNKVTPPRPGGD